MKWKCTRCGKEVNTLVDRKGDGKTLCKGCQLQKIQDENPQLRTRKAPKKEEKAQMPSTSVVTSVTTVVTPLPQLSTVTITSPTLPPRKKPSRKKVMPVDQSKGENHVPK